MPSKQVMPKLKEGTENTLYYLAHYQVTREKLLENKLELLRECNSRFQRFINHQYRCDKHNLVSSKAILMPFKSVPNKLLSWLLLGLLVGTLETDIILPCHDIYSMLYKEALFNKNFFNGIFGISIPREIKYNV